MNSPTKGSGTEGAFVNSYSRPGNHAHLPASQDPNRARRKVQLALAVLVNLILVLMEGCEGTDYSDTLGRLVTNAYNALPRWDLNGWSLEENTERITGKRRFFNADGTAMTLADSDPCPCGSGTPYGACGGHRRLAS